MHTDVSVARYSAAMRVATSAATGRLATARPSTPAHLDSSVHARPPDPRRNDDGSDRCQLRRRGVAHQVERRDFTPQRLHAVLARRDLQQRLAAAPLSRTATTRIASVSSSTSAGAQPSAVSPASSSATATSASASRRGVR